MRVIKGPGSEAHEKTMQLHRDYILSKKQEIKAQTKNLNAAAKELETLQGKLRKAEFTPKIAKIEQRYPQPENEVTGKEEVLVMNQSSPINGGNVYEIEDTYRYTEEEMEEKINDWSAKVTAEYPAYFEDKEQQQIIVASISKLNDIVRKANNTIDDYARLIKITIEKYEQLDKEEIQIELSDKDFENGSLKPDIRAELVRLKFDDKQINSFEVLQGIKKATMTLSDTVSPESKKHLDAIVKLASLNNTSGSMANNQIERIKEKIGRAITELNSKIESKDSKFNSEQKGIVQFFKNLLDAIIIKCTSKGPLVSFAEIVKERYELATDIHNTQLDEMKKELKSLREHDKIVPEPERPKDTEEADTEEDHGYH